MSDGLASSQREIDRAKLEIDKMRRGPGFEEFEAAWRDFLGSLERAWNKSQGAYKQRDYPPWRGAYKHERTTDPLLRYLAQARDAHEHSVAEVVGRQPGGIGIGRPGGSVHVHELRVTPESMTGRISGPDAVVTIFPETRKLLPVTSRGVTREPPNEHKGSPLDKMDPVSVAEAGLAFYQTFLNLARAKFGVGRS